MYHIGRAVSRWLWRAFTLPTAAPALARAVTAAFLAERERWILWAPVLFGTGIAGYFALQAEPPTWLAPLCSALAAAAAVVGRRHLPVVLAGIALALAGLGFAAIQARTHLVAAPVIAKRTPPLGITGRARAVEARAGDYRVTLDRLTIPRRDPKAVPQRIRITVRGAGSPPNAGDWLTLRAILLPPPAPSAPGAFDFQRQAWYARLGGVGFAISPPDRVEPPPGAGGGFDVWLGRLRQRVAARVRAALPGPSGAVAAALMTGDRGAIPRDVVQAMRDAGLAHLLAISGLHMGLLAGCVFFAVRGALALWERVALRHPIKKWAAVAAMAGGLAYLFLAGATIPTQRAYVMAVIVLLAIVLDRRAVSMRLVAWAAAIVLALSPESLLHVGFQMSFAAVLALVAAYEVCSGTLVRLRRGGGVVRRLGVYVVGVGLTTLIAGLATGLVAVHQFHRIVDYGLVANLAAVPVMAFWIMPAAVAAFALLPLGLEPLALLPMGLGIDAVLWIAETVSRWPGAVTLVPAAPAAALPLVAAGGLWLCLWRGRWRLFGIAGIAAGVLLLGLARGPDLLVSGDGKLFAARAAEGGLMLSSERAGRFARETWLARAGHAAALPWPSEGPSADGRLRCDSLGCIYRAKGWVVALPRDARALAEDCRSADLMLAAVPVRGRCPSARRVIDRFDLWRAGAHAVWLGGRGITVESVRAGRGDRPWVLKPTPRRRANTGGSGRSADPAP